MLPICPDARLFIHTKKPMIKMNGNKSGMRFMTQFDCGVLGLKSTPCVRSNSRSSSFGNPGGAVVEKELPSVNVPVMVSVALFNLTSSTEPLVTCVMNSSKPNFSRSGPGRSWGPKIRTKMRPRSTHGDHLGIDGRPAGLPSGVGASLDDCKRPDFRPELLLGEGVGDGGGGGGVDSLIPP